MENVIGHAIGTILAPCLVGAALTGIVMLFCRIIGRRLDRVETITAFVVTSLGCAALIIYGHFSH